MKPLTDPEAFAQLARLFARVDVPDDLNAWLHGHLRKTRTTRVVFDLQRAHGYVHLALDDGLPDLQPHPKIAGLDDAYKVFLAGPTARHVLHVEDFHTSANGLRNRLEAAARWADGVRCSPLAGCIRAISVGNSGGINFARPAGIELELTAER